MASSGAIYGDSDDFLTESESKIAPVDIYGLSKLFCEKISDLYKDHFPVTLVRLFNVYGPRETNPHIIPEIINQLRLSNTLNLGNIDTFRDFIHVVDVAKNFIELVSNNLSGINIVNLGTRSLLTFLILSPLLFVASYLVGYGSFFFYAFYIGTKSNRSVSVLAF